MKTANRRRMFSAIFVAFCAVSVLVALVPLGLVVFYVAKRGIQALSLSFFTHMPVPMGESGGGMANARPSSGLTQA